MKILTLAVPDFTYDQIASEASIIGIDPASFCSSLIAEHFATKRSATANARNPPVIRTAPQVGVQSTNQHVTTPYQVSNDFADRPRKSVDFAQTFVDAALALPHGRSAHRKGRMIAIIDNFVFVESLRTRGEAGIVVSFYGTPDKFDDPTHILKPGMHGYSRASVSTQAELQAVLPLVKQAHALKYDR